MGVDFLFKFNKKHRKKASFKLYISIFFTFFIIIAVLNLIDNIVFSAAEEISSDYAATYINEKIDELTENIIAERGLSYKDFYVSDSKEGEMRQITVNSVLVNEICSKISAGLSRSLTDADEANISLPLGMFTGIKLFSNTGPEVAIRLMPVGSAACDYASTLESGGINSVNYSIFLNIDAAVKIVCPFSSKTIDIKRKYVLVDTVFQGSVPEYYLNMNRADNTEN